MTLARNDKQFSTEIYDDKIEEVRMINVYMDSFRIVAEYEPHYGPEKGWMFPVSKYIGHQKMLDLMNAMKNELENYVNGYEEYADGYEDSMPADKKKDYLLESLNDIIDLADSIEECRAL